MLQDSKMRRWERRHEEMSISGNGGREKGDIVQGGDRKFYGSKAISRQSELGAYYAEM